jgi:hypothetical protein
VSEFAARCPGCRRSTDDAEYLNPDADPVTAGQSTPVSSRATGSDREPGKGSHRLARLPRKRAGLAMAALAAGAVLALIVGLLVGSGPSRPAAAGRVVSVDFNGIVVTSDPEGAHRMWLSPFGIFQNQGLVAAEDDRFLATSTGRLIAVDHDTLALTKVAAVVGTMALFGFSDHDEALVGLRPEGSEARPMIEIIDLTDGRAINLGNAAAVAGDPEGLGAFATVAAASQPNGPPPPGGYAGEADGRVELRDYAKPAVLLATSAQLEADLRQRPGAVNLEVLPDRQGEKVAVMLNPTAAGERGTGLVVLDRTGRVLGVVPASDGPLEYSQPAWSPDGTALVYPSMDQGGPAISVWKIAGSTHTRAAPNLGAPVGYCLWSATGTRFLCASTNFGADQTAQWVIGDARRGPLRKFPAAGVPLAWLSSPE